MTIPLSGTQEETPFARVAGLHFEGSALNRSKTTSAILSSKVPMSLYRAAWNSRRSMEALVNSCYSGGLSAINKVTVQFMNDVRL